MNEYLALQWKADGYTIIAESQKQLNSGFTPISMQCFCREKRLMEPEAAQRRKKWNLFEIGTKQNKLKNKA